MENKKLEAKIIKLQEFLKENKMGITATQEISKENRIVTVPLFHDLEKYEGEPIDVDFKE